MNQQHNDYKADTQLLSLGWWYVDESYSIDNTLTSALDKALRKYWYGILQYENCYWLQALRERISEWAPNFYKIPKFEVSSVLVTSWITAWLDLAWRHLLHGKYDAFIIEPCYDTAIRSLQRNANKIFSINASDNGDGFIRINQEQWIYIEKIFSWWSIKLFYIVPNFSNPSWLSISESDKIRLLELCKKFGVTIFEDDPYALYNYSENISIKTFYELDIDKSSVLYANSFSKIWFPWLRIWFLIGDPELIKEISEIQKYSISSPNLLTQWIVIEMIDAWIFNSVFEHRFAQMNKKYNIFFQQMSITKLWENNPNMFWVHWGFYVWLNVGGGSNFTELARSNWLVVIPWKIYWINNSYEQFVRVTFSQIDEQYLILAIKKLDFTSKQILS